MATGPRRERNEFGPDYDDHGVLFCWADGRPPHRDTITRRFKRLAAAAGLPEIDLHGVRHSYATAGRGARIDWKALSKRTGDADVAFTMKQYVPADLEADRQVANTLAGPIVGGLLASAKLTRESREDQAATAAGGPWRGGMNRSHVYAPGSEAGALGLKRLLLPLTVVSARMRGPWPPGE